MPWTERYGFPDALGKLDEKGTVCNQSGLQKGTTNNNSGRISEFRSAAHHEDISRFQILSSTLIFSAFEVEILIREVWNNFVIKKTIHIGDPSFIDILSRMTYHRKWEIRKSTCSIGKSHELKFIQLLFKCLLWTTFLPHLLIQLSTSR